MGIGSVGGRHGTPVLADPAQPLDAALRALADGSRRSILALVRDRPVAVGEIAGRVAMSQQAVSHHLRVLRGAGLVSERREGTRHLFTVRGAGFGVVREFLDEVRPARRAPLRADVRGNGQGDGRRGG